MGFLGWFGAPNRLSEHGSVTGVGFARDPCVLGLPRLVWVCIYHSPCWCFLSSPAVFPQGDISKQGCIHGQPAQKHPPIPPPVQTRPPVFTFLLGWVTLGSVPKYTVPSHMRVGGNCCTRQNTQFTSADEMPFGLKKNVLGGLFTTPHPNQ